MCNSFDRTWAEISIDNIAHNLLEIKKLTGNNTKIMGVVKANAYGHGSVGYSNALVKYGVDRLAVACLDEAIELRENSIDIPIQILGYTSEKRVNEIIEYNIIQTISDIDLALELSKNSVKRNIKIKIHIKLDTGMGRNGFLCNEDNLKIIKKIYSMPGIEIEGIMTHFASADEENSDYTISQFNLFMDYCNKLQDMGIHIPIKHVANSAAILNYPQMHLDMVRPGIAIYGIWREISKKPDINLKSVMTIKARIVNLKYVEKNTYISYGRTYKTNKKCKIATISIGYADGYPRNLSNCGKVLINGEFAPIVGTICMDYCMADVTEFKNIFMGEEVVLIGKSGSNEITAEEIACKLKTISYEVLSKIGTRLPRIYNKAIFD